MIPIYTNTEIAAAIIKRREKAVSAWVMFSDKNSSSVCVEKINKQSVKHNKNAR